MSKPTILVTGAGGFVGGTIVEALFFSGQYNVRAGLRGWMSGAPRVARFPISLVTCDIMKPAELAKAMAGVDYVIHCAVGDEKVIIDGTQNVLQAAIDAGVKRVVHISSVAVYGNALGDVIETTTAPPGTITEYGKAKIVSEAACRAAKIDSVILRPTIVYGPFSSRWTMLFAMRLKAGWKHLGPQGMGKCNLVHAHDLARYAIAACEQTGVVGKVFNINGPEIVTWNEYLERFSHSIGLPEMPVQTAGRTRTQIAMRAIETVKVVGKYAMANHPSTLRYFRNRSDRLKQLMDQTELKMRLTASQIELKVFTLDVIYRGDKATRLFGFPPSVTIDDGLTKTAAWLEHMGEAA